MQTCSKINAVITLATCLVTASLLVSCSAVTISPVSSATPLPTQPPPTATLEPQRSPTPIETPSSDQFAYEDKFGDGFIARLPFKETNNLSNEDIVRILVSHWLDHYKGHTTLLKVMLLDYTVDNVSLMKDRSYDPFYPIVAGVRFSILPAQIPNDWASFPGDLIHEGDTWWHMGAPFGVFREGDDYRLRLVSGWGT